MLNLVKGSLESKSVVTKKYQKLSYCLILLINIIFGKEEVGSSNLLVGSNRQRLPKWEAFFYEFIFELLSNLA